VAVILERTVMKLKLAQNAEGRTKNMQAEFNGGTSNVVFL